MPLGTCGQNPCDFAGWLRPEYCRMIAILRQSTYPSEGDPTEIEETRENNLLWVKTLQEMNRNVTTAGLRDAQHQLELLRQLYHSVHDPELDGPLKHLIQIWEHALKRDKKVP
jgi:hypothetical protein